MSAQITQENSRFVIPGKQPLSDTKLKLKKQFSFDEGPVRSVRRVYYDSFDWRIYQSGGMLEVEMIEKGKLRLRWLDRDSGQSLGSLPVSVMPQFIWDFPAGPFKKRLEPILDVRALLPQITIKSDIHPLKLLNKERKMVLQAFCEENTLLTPKHRKAHALGKCLRLMPVRGYKEPVSRILTGIANMQKMKRTPMEQALALLDIDPGSFAAKWDPPLAPSLTTEQALKLIFTYLLQTLEKNESGLRQDLDSEFLHDFRVAVRRIRSGLGQLKQVFPQKPLARFRQDFTWLGQVTSRLRDLDVYLLKFDDYQAELPQELRDDLEPLRELLQREKRSEHLNLVKALDSPRYRRFLKEWNQFLKRPFFPESPSLSAQQPLYEVASERIWRVYRRILRDGGSIKPDTPEEIMHELRKTCKKLRYLMEFFQSLYPAEEIRFLIKVLKRLQDNLGEFQDYQVQWSSLMDFGEQITGNSHGSPNTHMALGMLVKDLKNQQTQARRVFQTRFEEFAATDHQKHFKRLFRKGNARMKGI